MSSKETACFTHCSGEMVDLIKDELSSARRDADRVSSLIAESAAVLSSSFRTIGDLAANSENSTETPRHDTKVLVKSINEAVQALQFEDVSLQLLAHLSNRLDDLASLITVVESTVSAVEGMQENPDGDKALQSVQHKINSQIQKLREQRDSPVGHDADLEGSVELF